MVDAASPEERGQFVQRQLILSTHDIFHVHDHNKLIEKWCQMSQSFMSTLYRKTIQLLNLVMKRDICWNVIKVLN